MANSEDGVFFVGRLANYKYFNMDEAILNALELFDDKFVTAEGSEEVG
jgi:UDP-galactopyranose mutase